MSATTAKKAMTWNRALGCAVVWEDFSFKSGKSRMLGRARAPSNREEFAQSCRTRYRGEIPDSELNSRRKRMYLAQ